MADREAARAAGSGLELARYPVTLALIAANVVAFAIAANLGAGLWTARPDALVRLGSNFGPLATDGERWRAVTALFLHLGLWHLAINMLALAELGGAAERLFGSPRLLFLYLASGVAASLASVAWNPWVNSAGASGAIFGLLGALLARSTSPTHRLSRPTVIRHWLTAGAFVAFSILVDLAGVGVDNAAHLGGLATGFVIGLALTLGGERRRPAPFLVALALAAAVCLAFVGLQRNAGPAWRQETAFTADLEQLVADENARAAAIRASHAEWRSGRIDRNAHADDILLHAALLDAGRKRLGAYPLDPSSPTGAARLQRALDSALALRVDAMELRAAAVRTNDRELAEAAERAMEKSDAVWRREMCVRSRKAPQDCDAGTG